MARKLALCALVTLVVAAAAACGPTPAPEIVEKVVTQVVEVQKEVTKIVEGTPVVETVVEVQVVTATPVPEQKGGSLTVAQREEPPGPLDPSQGSAASQQNVMMNIYDSLVFMTPGTNEIIPWLAESWDVSDDGLTWTFNLRQDVTFHDGTPFNAEAVRFNLERIKGGTGVSVGMLGPYESSEVVDEYTIKVNFAEPFAPLLDGLSQAFMGIVSPTAVEKWGEDYGRHPVGTGPFIFKEWAAKDHITLVRNPDYKWAPTFFKHKGPAYLEEVTIKFIAEPATRLAVLESGEVDVIELVPEEEVSRLATDPKYTVRKASVPGLPEQLWFNTEKTPTNELAVRQAFNYAIDRQTIAATISFNVAPVCYGPLSETTLCFDQDLKKDYPYPYDPEKAMQILEQAGWVAGQDGIREKDGQRLEVVMTKSASIAPYMELIQAMLRDIGADVSIADMSFGSKFEMNARGDFQMTHMAWVSKDPSVLESTFHSKNIPEDGGPGYAFTRFRDESLDRAIEESLIALDMQERCALVEDAQQTIMKNALIVPLYDLVQSVGMRSEVKDLYMDARTYYRLLYDAWVEE